MADTVSVIIADDHKIIRDAISGGLAARNGYRVLAEVDNGLDAIAAVKVHRPAILFLDISMPLANGVEIINDVRRWSPDTRIVVFTGVNTPGLLAAMVDSGIHGIFSKASAPEAMFDRLPLILQGAHYVDPVLVDAIARGGDVERLTDRERQTLNMIVAGKSSKEIAQLLNISPKTVDKHRTSLMQKLEVHSVAELMARAVKEGLIDPFTSD